MRPSRAAPARARARRASGAGSPRTGPTRGSARGRRRARRHPSGAHREAVPSSRRCIPVAAKGKRHRTSARVPVLEVPSMRRPLLLPTLMLLALVVPAAARAQTIGAAPTVVTGTASPVDATTATVHGGVDPNGQPASYRFEYGTTTSYGYTTAIGSAGSGSSSVSESADI